ncbi:hypothetical protein [Maricaulis sp.]|uniref:hypothetical protein n=1 Tax=Maricaulis sp. TaxID=1486257 RepID=UPI002629366C|nr:hypothetical protein [Maricaulis sp.]
MMTSLFAAAAVLGLVTFAIHIFAGGPVVARPLLADTHLPAASKWLNYYCWHITTVLLVFIAAGFAAAAVRPDAWVLAIFLTVLCLALSVLSAGIALRGGLAPLRLPSTSLFALTGCLGLAGIIAG